MNDLKIWVGVLADYNAGRLHGQWYDLDDYTDAEDLGLAVRKDLLVTSRYPNVEIECPFCGGDGIDTNQHDSVCTHCHGDGVMPAAEEVGIFDHDGFPEGMVGEYTQFSALFEYKEQMEEAESEFGRDGPEIVEAFYHCFGVGAGDVTIRQIRDAYRGEYKSGADFAEEFYRETSEPGFMDQQLINYVDWNRVWEGEFEQGTSEHNGYYFWSDWS